MSVAGDETAYGIWPVVWEGRGVQVSLEAEAVTVHSDGTAMAWPWAELRHLTFPTSNSMNIETVGGEQIALRFRALHQQREFKRALDECRRNAGRTPSPARRQEMAEARSGAADHASRSEGRSVECEGLSLQPAPGWYADVRAPGKLRYWDGETWTAHPAPSRPQAGESDGSNSRPSQPTQLAAAPKKWLWGGGVVLVLLVGLTALLVAGTSTDQSQGLVPDGSTISSDEAYYACTQAMGSYVIEDGVPGADGDGWVIAGHFTVPQPTRPSLGPYPFDCYVDGEGQVTDIQSPALKD